MFHGSLKNIALPRAITISENVTEVKTSGCLKTFADFVKRRKQIFILLSSKKIDEKHSLRMQTVLSQENTSRPRSSRPKSKPSDNQGRQ
jgi:hypothetical protein